MTPDRSDDGDRAPTGEEAFRALSSELGRRLSEAIDPWLRRVVTEVVGAGAIDANPELGAMVELAARHAAADVGPVIRAELDRDADDQRANPLALARRAVPYATAVLVATGLEPVERDPVEVRARPDDLFELSPARFADIDPDLHDLGLAWGAARAMVHRRRHGE